MSWHTKPLGEIAEVIRGVTYQKHALLPEGHPDGIALLRATNVQGQFVDYENPVTVPRSMVTDSQMLRPGDVLVASSSGSESVVGKNSMVVDHIAATFGAFCTVVRPSGVNPRFLAHFLGSLQVRQRWRAVAKGSNINNLRSSEIVGTPVPLPPLEEQRRIVAELEDHLGRLDATRTQLAETKTQLESLRDSCLSAFFGFWRYETGDYQPVTQSFTLGDVARWGSGGTPSASNGLLYGGDIPWAVIGDLNEGTVVKTEKTITKLGLDSSSAKWVPEGAVLIAMYGASIGRLGIAGREMTTNQAIAHAIPDPDLIDRDYLFHFLRSSRNRLVSLGKGGAQSNISQTILKAFRIDVPPLDVQRTVVSRIASVDASINEIEAKLRESEEMIESARASVLHRAFSGGRDD